MWTYTGLLPLTHLQANSYMPVGLHLAIHFRKLCSALTALPKVPDDHSYFPLTLCDNYLLPVFLSCWIKFFDVQSIVFLCAHSSYILEPQPIYVKRMRVLFVPLMYMVISMRGKAVNNGQTLLLLSSSSLLLLLLLEKTTWKTYPFVL